MKTFCIKHELGYLADSVFSCHNDSCY